MKNALAGFLALIFGLVLGLTLVAWVANATILKPQTVVSAIPSEAYPAMAKGLPSAIGQLTPLTEDEKVILTQQIDPALMRSLADSVVTQEVQYLHGKGPVPQINLQILANRLRLEGAPLPAQVYDQLDKPIVLKTSGANQTAVSAVGGLDRLRLWGPFIALVLAVLIWLMGAHFRFRTLAKGAGVAAVVLGVSLLVVGAIPSLASSGLSTSQMAAIAAPVKKALAAVTHGYTHEATQVMLALLALAMVLVVAHVLFGRKPKHHR